MGRTIYVYDEGAQAWRPYCTAMIFSAARPASPHVWLMGGALLLLVSRLTMQWLLLRAGFEALSADEFGRSVLAAQWARAPYALWHGFWLPFHTYLVGSAVGLHWELLWVPRALAIGFGLCSIGLMAWLGRRLFNSWRVGGIAALLLMLNPVHLWLSTTPLTEIMHTALLLACLVGAVGYLQSGRHVDLAGGTLALALANGFRFEAWMSSAVWSLLFVGIAGWRVWQGSARREAGVLVLAALVPWLFPVMWMAESVRATGHPLAFSQAITTYKLTWYGPSRSFANYLPPLLQMDPLATVLTLPALLGVLATSRRRAERRWFVAVAGLPFALFLALHGGQQEPPGNYLRYLAPFLFMGYPALAWLLVRVATLGTTPRWRTGLLAGLLGLVVCVQVPQSLRFSNDPAAQGVAVGRHIRALRAADVRLGSRPVLIELAYWQYLAIHVGANDLEGILYDRPLDFERRASTSMLLAPPDVVRACLAARDISMLVLESEALRAVAEIQLGLTPAQTVNGYTFYPLPEREEPASTPCTLAIGSLEG